MSSDHPQADGPPASRTRSSQSNDSFTHADDNRPSFRGLAQAALATATQLISPAPLNRTSDPNQSAPAEEIIDVDQDQVLPQDLPVDDFHPASFQSPNASATNDTNVNPTPMTQRTPAPTKPPAPTPPSAPTFGQTDVSTQFLLQRIHSLETQLNQWQNHNNDQFHNNRVRNQTFIRAVENTIEKNLGLPVPVAPNHPSNTARAAIMSEQHKPTPWLPTHPQQPYPASTCYRKMPTKPPHVPVPVPALQPPTFQVAPQPPVPAPAPAPVTTPAPSKSAPPASGKAPPASAPPRSQQPPPPPPTKPPPPPPAKAPPSATPAVSAPRPPPPPPMPATQLPPAPPMPHQVPQAPLYPSGYHPSTHPMAYQPPYQHTTIPQFFGTNAAPAPMPMPPQPSPATSQHIPAQLMTATIAQLLTKEKLTFPKLTKATRTAYAEWRATVLSSMKTNPRFRQYIQFTVQTGLYIHYQLTVDDNDYLYSALVKALDSSIKTEIGIDECTVTDGVRVLQLLDEEYGLLAKTQLEKNKLVSQLYAVQKSPNETIPTYHTRFVLAVRACQVNNVLPFTDMSDLFILYLTNTREPAFYNVIMEISSRHPSAQSWLVCTSLEQIRNKAKEHLRTYASIYGTPSPSPGLGSAKTPSKLSKKQIEERIERFEAYVTKADDSAIINHLRQQMARKKGGCFLHDTMSHPYHKCAQMRGILKELDKMRCLEIAQKVPKKSPTGNPSKTAKPTADKPKSDASLIRAKKALVKKTKDLDNTLKEATSLLSALRATASYNGTAFQNPFAALSNDDADDESEIDLDSILDEEVEDNDVTEDDNVEDNSNTPDESYTTSTLSSSHSISLSNPTISCHVTSTVSTPHNITVVDSGATDHMCNNRSKFEHIIPVTDSHGKQLTVFLGDGTSLPVCGMGPVREQLENGKIIRYLAYFVPELSCSLYSVLQHSKSQGCYFYCSDSTAILAFPTFLMNLTTVPEITFRTSTSRPTASPTFDYEIAKSTKAPTKITAKVVNPRYIHKDFSSSQQARLATDLPISIQSDQLIPIISPPSLGPTYDKFIPSDVNITIPADSTAAVPTGMRFDIPTGFSLHINSLLHKPYTTLTKELQPSDNELPLILQIHNTSSEPVVIPRGTILATFSVTDTHGKTHVFLPTHPSSSPTTSSSPSRSSPPSSRRSSRRFQVFHTTNGSILVDHKHPHKPRALRINRPMFDGVRQPRSSSSPSSPQWTSHSLNDSESSAESPQLHQSHPTKKPVTPAVPPAVSPTASEKPNASTRSHVHATIDDLRQSIGFLHPEKLLRNLDFLGNGKYSVSGIRRNPTVDPGEAASIKATKRNSKPSPPPQHYSDTVHMDIGYGPCTAHGGIKYTLLFVDKATRYKRVYPLKNLTTSLAKAVKLFFKDVKIKPKTIRTDFDKKLLHGEVAKYIEETQGVTLEAAPPNRQHQNGLVERAWQTAVDMTRNWLTSSLLPTKYWWFGMKRAIEIMNIMPTSHLKHGVSTPHELVYGTKVDYRTLFPLFSVAYLKQTREQGGHHKNKFKSRTLKCILVGSDPKSDGLQFYHPPSKQLLSGSNGFRLDPQLPSGPQFSETYDGTFLFNTRSDMDCLHKPLSHEENKTVFFRDPSSSTTTYIEATILSPPLDDDSDPYTIQVKSTGDIHEFMASDLLDSDPTATPAEDPTSLNPFPLYPWIIPNGKATLYLQSSMNRPRQGYLRRSDSGDWSFSPGRTGKQPAIPLHNFSELAPTLVSNKKLFRGWKSVKSVITARHIRAISNVIARHSTIDAKTTSTLIARHVSAATLHAQEAPSLLRHHLLHPHDKKLWDEAYLEEINGLLKLNTWEVITEDEYRRLKSVTGKALPTMAISKIKKDENGNPQRCKYRIVVLGNLDNYNWDKSDCFAPVLSQPEMRLLTSISARMKRIPKCGDVSQAFCQGVLPPTEQYVIRPPPGCPYTPKNSYWRLLRTLYGLKRSPRHWYEKAKSILLSIGLKPLKNSHCIFRGTIIPGQPPLYIGLYVDDFIYFSASDLVERTFEEKFGSAVTTTFEGEVTHFLGINFQSTRHADGHVSIHLSQEAFIDTLQQRTHLDSPDVSPVPSPYRSGLPIDKLPPPSPDIDKQTQDRYNHKLQQLTGAFQWLATSTRPDIATVTNLLAQHNHKATKAHLDAAKWVIRYLKGTKSLGIAFHSRRNHALQSFIKFPLSPTTLTPFTDANWGPQDQSKPKPNDPPVALFKSRSISGFLLWINGPVHWSSRRQAITARSTAEAEIYATDECVKYLQYIHNILEELSLHNSIMPRPTVIYNDNAACVAWSHSLSTKGLRHIQIRENAIREQVQLKNVSIKHIQGALNLSDMFTKEEKNISHFLQIRDFILERFLPSISDISQSTRVEGGDK